MEDWQRQVLHEVIDGKRVAVSQGKSREKRQLLREAEAYGTLLDALEHESGVAAERVANALANIAYNRGWPQEHPNEYLKIAKALLRHARGG